MGSFARAAGLPVTIGSEDDAVSIANGCTMAKTPRPIVSRVIALSHGHLLPFRNLLLALDEPSRFARFAVTPSDSCLIEHSRAALSTVAWIAGAFVNDELRGVVELYDEPDLKNVEAAFVVAEGFRRRGLGTALLHAAIAWARQSGRQRLRMIFSAHNVAMRRLAQKTGARLDMMLGEMVADIATGGAHNGDPDGENSSSTKMEAP